MMTKLPHDPAVAGASTAKARRRLTPRRSVLHGVLITSCSMGCGAGRFFNPQAGSAGLVENDPNRSWFEGSRGIARIALIHLNAALRSGAVTFDC